MSQTLVIAEKPSVAGDIARALGGFTKDGNFWVSETMVIGSAVGHLLELKAPAEYEVKRGKWSFANLPVLPPQFDLAPIERTKERFAELQKKLRSRAVTDVINACDAGREGELIFRYLMQAAFEGKKAKPVRRLWLQSMTKNAIREAFSQLRSDAEMKPLEAAARCRSEADWLVGINGTRAMTAFNFVPKAYWEVRATFAVENGTYESVWIDPDFKKEAGQNDLKAERLWSAERAQAVAVACRGGKGGVEDKKRRTRQASPALFDLTSLQREANGRFGFSAKTTLSIAQALYEKHKVLTYPRTDARALPEDYIETVNETLTKLRALSTYDLLAGRILANGWVKPDPRVFDNAKISDHFAIIPTGELPKTLSEAEQKVYDLVVRRFLSVFYPAAEYDVTTRLTTVAGQVFRTEGKVLVEPGWLEVRGLSASHGRNTLPSVAPGEQALVDSVEAVAEQTRPPARYTEATLLSAMENAGKKIEEDQLRDAMAEKGLGTPATRSGIIENLIEQHYMRRDERDLVATPKAVQLMALLKGLSIAQLSEPKLTAEWEQKLALIERGEGSADAFMEDIRALTRQIVSAAADYEGNSVPIDNPIHIHAPCPMCGGEVVENYRYFSCTTPTCGFRVSKSPGSRVFAPEEVETLLSTWRVGPLAGFVSKRGFPFEAELLLKRDESTGEVRMQFDFDEDDKETLSTDQIANAPVIGRCPCCGANVRVLDEAYMCETAMVDRKKCVMRVARTILGHELTLQQASGLFESGETEVFSDFVSKRTKRPFRASLKLDAKKGVVFQFPEKEAEGASQKGAESAKSRGGKVAESEGAAKKPSARTRKKTT